MVYLADGAGGVAVNLWGPALGALGVIAAAVFTTITTLRTSQRATALQKQQQLDQRSDREYERVVAQRDEAEAELEKARTAYDAMRKQRDEAIEGLAELRYRVWLAGHDPAMIGREPGIEPRPRI